MEKWASRAAGAGLAANAEAEVEGDAESVVVDPDPAQREALDGHRIASRGTQGGGDTVQVPLQRVAEVLPDPALDQTRDQAEVGGVRGLDLQVVEVELTPREGGNAGHHEVEGVAGANALAGHLRPRPSAEEEADPKSAARPRHLRLLDEGVTAGVARAAFEVAAAALGQQHLPDDTLESGMRERDLGRGCGGRKKRSRDEEHACSHRAPAEFRHGPFLSPDVAQPRVYCAQGPGRAELSRSGRAARVRRSAPRQGPVYDCGSPSGSPGRTTSPCTERDGGPGHART